MNIMDTLKKPLVMAVLALFVGIFLGITYAYAIDPVRPTELPMNMTREDLQNDYLRMAIDSFRVTRDAGMAGYRYNQLGEFGPRAMKSITDKPDLDGVDPRVLERFQTAVLEYVAPVSDVPAPTDGGGANMLIATLIIVVALIVLGLVGFFFVLPLFKSNKRAIEDMTPAMQAAEHSRTMEKTDYSTVSSTPPVAQYVTTYVLGDDLFDDSFSIDAPSGEFLGECGVGISETVGGADPKKVTAFEVWMFDKNDIQTVTKVLMSSNAFSDLALRAKLEPKGELVQVEPRKQVLLETQTLQMVATISDMQYGQSAMPNGSYFDRVTIELGIWQKAK